MKSKLKELLEKYLTILNSQNVYEQEVHRDITKQLNEAGIPKKILNTFKSSSSKVNPVDDYNKLIDGLANTELLKANKDLCLRYFEFLSSRWKTLELRTAALAKTEKEISCIDPISIKYLKYRIQCLKARKELEKSLKNETPESLQERFPEIDELLGENNAI